MTSGIIIGGGGLEELNTLGEGRFPKIYIITNNYNVTNPLQQTMCFSSLFSLNF